MERNLSWGTNENTLRDVFSTIGEVADAVCTKSLKKKKKKKKKKKELFNNANAE